MPGRDAKPVEYSPNGVLYLGSYLRSVRQGRGWRLADVAEQVGCTISALSNIETNKVLPSARLLEALAQALEIPAADLQACPTPPARGRDAPGRAAPAMTRVNGAAHHPRPPRPVAGARDELGQPVPADAPTRPVAVTTWSLGQQVEAVVASFQLTPAEAAFAGTLVVELTRSLCLQLKDHALPAWSASRP